MTPAEASTVLGLLKGAFPEATISEHTVALWSALLHDLPADAVTRWVVRWCAVERRMPHVADVRDSVSRELGTAPPDVDQAWLEVRGEISRVGTRGLPRWSHQAVREAVAAVGWFELCTSKMPGVDRAHFARAYQATAKRAVTAASGSLVAELARPLHRLVTGADRRALSPAGVSVAKRDDVDWRREVQCEFAPAPPEPSKRRRP